MIFVALTLLLASMGGYLWALRGGNFWRENKPGEKKKSTQLNRLIYLIPTMVLVGLGLKILFPIPFPILGLAGATSVMAVGIILGHGLFMDMGRFKPVMTATREHEYPFTFLIGPEDYRWPFWRRWLHNCAGMALVGLIRHAWVWAFVFILSVPQLAIYQLLGLLHPFLYEVGHQFGRSFINKKYLQVPPEKHTLFGELLVGALLWGGLIILR